MNTPRNVSLDTKTDGRSQEHFCSRISVEKPEKPRVPPKAGHEQMVDNVIRDVLIATSYEKQQRRRPCQRQKEFEQLSEARTPRNKSGTTGSSGDQTNAIEPSNVVDAATSLIIAEGGHT